MSNGQTVRLDVPSTYDMIDVVQVVSDAFARAAGLDDDAVHLTKMGRDLNADDVTGEWIGLVYSSGNRDERVFAEPHRLDIGRNPNPHLGFGGGGPHYCMGNFVAKMQLRAIFDELLHRAPTLELGEPEYLAGNFVHAVKSMPCRIR